MWAVKSLKICTLMGSFYPKHINDQQVQKSYVSWHLKVIQIKANSCEICIFLCDAIDLKQSVEGTLKVLGKS